MTERSGVQLNPGAARPGIMGRISAGAAACWGRLFMSLPPERKGERDNRREGAYGQIVDRAALHQQSCPVQRLGRAPDSYNTERVDKIEDSRKGPEDGASGQGEGPEPAR